jgi:hypothetical protein
MKWSNIFLGVACGPRYSLQSFLIVTLSTSMGFSQLKKDFRFYR